MSETNGNGKHLPAKTSGPPQIPVAITEPTVSDKDAEEALQRQGLVRVSIKTVDDLAKVGIYLTGAGVLRHQRGRAYITQERLDEGMRTILSKMGSKGTSAKNIVAMAEKLAQLSRAMTESQHLMIEIETLRVSTGGGPAEEPEAPNASFQPGSKVVPPSTTIVKAEAGSTVHLHGAGEKKPEPPPQSA